MYKWNNCLIVTKAEITYQRDWSITYHSSKSEPSINNKIETILDELANFLQSNIL